MVLASRFRASERLMYLYYLSAGPHCPFIIRLFIENSNLGAPAWLCMCGKIICASVQKSCPCPGLDSSKSDLDCEHAFRTPGPWIHNKNIGKYSKLPRGAVTIEFGSISKPLAGWGGPKTVLEWSRTLAEGP